MNIGMHVSLSILVSSGCMPSSGIARSYGSSTPSFLRNLHTVLHSGLPVCWYVSICIQMEKWIEGKNEDRCTRNNKEQAKLLRIVINLIYLLIMGFLCKYSKQMQNAIKIEINKWFTKVTLWKQTLHKLKKISKGYKIIWKVFTA